MEPYPLTPNNSPLIGPTTISEDPDIPRTIPDLPTLEAPPTTYDTDSSFAWSDVSDDKPEQTPAIKDGSANQEAPSSPPTKAKNIPPHARRSGTRYTKLKRPHVDHLPPPRNYWKRTGRETAALTRQYNGNWRNTDLRPDYEVRAQMCDWTREPLLHVPATPDRKRKRTGRDDGEWEDVDGDESEGTEESVSTNRTVAEESEPVDMPEVVVTDPDGDAWVLTDETEYPPLSPLRYGSWEDALADLRERCPGLRPGAVPRRRFNAKTCDCAKRRKESYVEKLRLACEDVAGDETEEGE